MVKKSDYDIKKLIMMQKLQPRTTDLKLTKIGHVDRVNVIGFRGKSFASSFINFFQILK